MKKSKSIQALIRRERARGRAEAVTILASICPEDGVDKLIGCSSNGESGDYSSYWDVDALRKLFCADSETCDVIDRLQGAHEYSHYLKYDLDRAREALALAVQAPGYTERLNSARLHFIARDMLSDLARRYGGDVSDELADVLRGLDAAMAKAGVNQDFYPMPADLAHSLGIDTGEEMAAVTVTGVTDQEIDRAWMTTRERAGQ